MASSVDHDVDATDGLRFMVGIMGVEKVDDGKQ